MRLRVKKEVADKIVGLTKKDFKVSYFRASGPGGQHRNKTDTACRVTHIATGITSEAVDSRSQSTNRENAFKKLVVKLVEHYESQMQTEERKMNSGWNEKIRTYHQPRGTVKEHRTGITLGYDGVLNGDIDKFIEESFKQLENGG